MPQSTVHFVGTEAEVAHHAAPLAGEIEYRISPPESVVQKACPGDIAIFYSEHFDRFRDACEQLKTQNVATLYMIDGILEWRNAWEDAADGPACPYAMRPALSHKVACIGTSQKRVLDSWGNQHKTEIVGIPRLDRLPRLADPPSKRPPDGPFRVLVATAKTPAFTPQQLETVKACLRDVQRFFNDQPRLDGRRLELVWRVPEGLAQEMNIATSVGNFSGADLAAQLGTVDAVLSTASTLMLEAMLFDLPVALLDYHNTPAYVKTAWAIRAASQIGPTIGELVNPPERKMLFQRTELQDATYLQSDATGRMVGLIQSMQSMAAKHQQDGEPLRFPANMLPPPETSLDRFMNPAMAFPDANEFSQTDQVELQSQLAHSRREIGHLQSQLAIRESELAHAHSIFNKINRHPIVGPLIKLGRWWRRGKNDNR